MGYLLSYTGVGAKTLAKGALTPLLWITVRASTSDSRELIPEARDTQPERAKLPNKEAGGSLLAAGDRGWASDALAI